MKPVKKATIALSGAQLARSVKFVVVGSIALLAFAAMSAGAASAKTVVELKAQHDPPLAIGAPLELTMFYTVPDSGKFCNQHAFGDVVTNGMKVDSIGFASTSNGPCSQISVSGGVAEAQYSAGKVTFRWSPAMAITLPGPCVYALKDKVAGTRNPEWALMEPVTMTGKLARAQSSAGCASNQPITVENGDLASEVEPGLWGATEAEVVRS